MRLPFEDILPVEPVSRGKLSALMLLSGVLNSAVILAVLFFKVFPSINSKLSKHDDLWMLHDILFWTAGNFTYIFIVVVFNVSIIYAVLIFLNSPELRVLLRWALHASVWAFLLVVMCFIGAVTAARCCGT